MGAESLATERGALWQRWYDEVWSGRSADAIHELVDPEVVFHPGGVDRSVGLEGFAAFHAGVLARFSRVEGAVHDPIAMGPWISVRTTLRLVEADSGAELVVQGLQRARLDDAGRFAEVWDSWAWAEAFEDCGRIAGDTLASFLIGSPAS